LQNDIDASIDYMNVGHYAYPSMKCESDSKELNLSEDEWVSCNSVERFTNQLFIQDPI